MKLYQQLPLFANRPIIRLLEIRLNDDFTASGGVPTIEASADTYDLRDGPVYDALSYVWGPQDLSANITVNGESFPVSQNLFAALQQICRIQREIGHLRKLWIDAICINQSDNAEKSHQVMRMRDIYANANMVLAWIGQPDSFSALAFDTLGRFLADDGASGKSMIHPDVQDEANERRTAIQLFVEREYFVRIWIVQEVVVARKVTLLCGALSMDFDSIHVALQRITGTGFYLFSPATVNISYIGHWRISFHETGVLEKEEDLDLRLFLDSRDRKATDPRDKIFALRGIANKAFGTSIQVSYDDSVESVYTDFSKMVLRIRPDLQILSAVNLRHRKISKLALPSYVPDWTLPKYGGGFLQRYYRFKPMHLFRAAGTSTPRVRSTKNSDTISIEGSYLDTISRIIPIKTLLEARDDTSVSLNETILRKLAADVILSDNYAFTGEQTWVAYFRTLTADRSALSPRIDGSYRSRYLAAFSEWGLQHSQGEISDLPVLAWERVSIGIGTIIEDKVMFLTSKGYLGLGHEGVDEGDAVCILSGGEVPFALRETPQKEGGPLFEFLCECYIHGVMDGEAVDELKSSLQEFLVK